MEKNRQNTLLNTLKKNLKYFIFSFIIIYSGTLTFLIIFFNFGFLDMYVFSFLFFTQLTLSITIITIIGIIMYIIQFTLAEMNSDILIEMIDIEQRMLKESNRIGIEKHKIQKWLNNFYREEQEFAIRLIEHIRYINEDSLVEICRDLYIKLLENTKRNLEDFRFITFGKETKSEKMIAYHFALKATKGGIPEELFIDVYNESFKFPTEKTIVYVDDVIGTGDQFLSNWTQFHIYALARNKIMYQKFIETNDFISLPLFTTKNGKKEVEEYSPFTVINLKHHILDETNMSLRIEAKIYNKHELSKVERIFRRYGQKLYPDHPLGYGNYGLLLSFSYNTPNNTLPVIWQNSPSEQCKSDITWYPIFPRYERRKLKDV